MSASIKKLLFILLIFTGVNTYAQAPANKLKALVNSLSTFKDNLPVEKLYLQTDKPYYAAGDTLHFKAYLLNADYLTPSTRSGLLYIELDDAMNRTAKRIMVPVVSGISWGDIALIDKEVPEGSYTLRAYTNWMRNFGEDYVFKKNIYVAALSGSTLVKANFKLDSIAGKNKVMANIQLTDLNGTPLRLKNLELKVMNGRHNLFRDKINTGMDGNMAVNFDLADKTAINDLSIIAQQTGKDADTATLTIPVIINRSQQTDLQFMPEGGNLVAGIKTRVGFKAIHEDGKATDVAGRILDSKQRVVATFRSAHKGMGSFEFIPQGGEIYTASIGTTKNYTLPVVNAAGTVLRINSKGDDSLEVVVNNTADANNSHYLIAQARGVVCYAATAKDAGIKKVISTSLFPTGIVRFTLLDQNNVPLNDRVVFIDHHDNLNIQVQANNRAYQVRDSVGLTIKVTDKEGKPVQGTFSLAVTDNSQVKPDSLSNNILNNLLFTSDLKGTIEEPGWYF